MKQATKFLMSSTVVAVALAAGAVALFGQWADYPTTGPRTSDGKVDLKAPPPRTAEGKIDFTGLWEPARGKPRGKLRELLRFLHLLLLLRRRLRLLRLIATSLRWDNSSISARGLRKVCRR